MCGPVLSVGAGGDQGGALPALAPCAEAEEEDEVSGGSRRRSSSSSSSKSNIRSSRSSSSKSSSRTVDVAAVLVNRRLDRVKSAAGIY